MKQQIIEAYTEQLSLIEKLFTAAEFEQYCQEELAHLIKVNSLKRKLVERKG